MLKRKLLFAHIYFETAFFLFAVEDTDVSSESLEDEYIRKTSLPPPRKDSVSLEYLTLLMLQDVQVFFETLPLNLFCFQ